MQCYATAGAPGRNGDYVRDEDFNSRPLSRNFNSPGTRDGGAWKWPVVFLFVKSTPLICGGTI